MARYRSILSLLLAFVTAFLVSCGAPEVKPPTYTAAQLQAIEKSVSVIEGVRDRLPELAKLIQNENWVFVRNFIHGPLGDLRPKMSLMERNLLPAAQPKAKALGKELFDDLVDIDTAAQNGDYKAAIRSYASLQKDIEAFLQLAPNA